jgi:glucosamine--fructose-6-phosphate aminotransferase (isomerizing)
LGILCADFPDQFIAARKDSPLVLGLGEGCNFIASDIPAILSHTRRIVILEDRDIARITRDKVELFDAFGRPVTRQPLQVTWDSEAAEKGGYEHFMMKEIHEEPRAVRDTVMPRIRGNGSVLRTSRWTAPLWRILTASALLPVARRRTLASSVNMLSKNCAGFR